MSKFEVGQKVVLFNSISKKFEEDEVYGVLFLPVVVEGVTQDAGLSISEALAKGQKKVAEQYQLCAHQGVLDADVLFASEEECKSAYREIFK